MPTKHRTLAFAFLSSLVAKSFASFICSLVSCELHARPEGPWPHAQRGRSCECLVCNNSSQSTDSVTHSRAQEELPASKGTEFSISCTLDSVRISSKSGDSGAKWKFDALWATTGIKWDLYGGSVWCNVRTCDRHGWSNTARAPRLFDVQISGIALEL